LAVPLFPEYRQKINGGWFHEMEADSMKKMAVICLAALVAVVALQCKGKKKEETQRQPSADKPPATRPASAGPSAAKPSDTKPSATPPRGVVPAGPKAMPLPRLAPGEDPFKSLIGLRGSLVRGMNSVLKDGALVKGFAPFPVQAKSRVALGEFLRVARTAGFRSVADIVIELELVFFKNDKPIHQVKGNFLVTSKAVALVEFKSKARTTTPAGVWPAAYFTGPLAPILAAARGFAAVVRLPRCARLKAADPAVAKKWVPPQAAAPVIKAIKGVRTALGGSCAQLGKLEYSTFKIGLDEVIFLVRGSDGKPRGFIRTRFGVLDGKPGLIATGEVKPLGGRPSGTPSGKPSGKPSAKPSKKGK
jgi:hypothetical protein